MKKYIKTFKTDYGTLGIYRDRKGELRWHIVGKNGEEISAGTEGHKTMRTVWRSIKLTHATSAHAMFLHENPE